MEMTEPETDILCTVCFHSHGSENRMVKRLDNSRGKLAWILYCKVCDFSFPESEIYRPSNYKNTPKVEKDVSHLKRQVTSLSKNVSELTDIVKGKTGSGEI